MGKRMFERDCGILMHLSSLPSNYGIGTMGQAAYDFVDFLESAGQGYWQILPINPTGKGDSPYQSVSAFAGNPYFIDMELLEKDGLLKKEDYAGLDWGSSKNSIDYDKVHAACKQTLRGLFEHIYGSETKEYYEFCSRNDWWLNDYAVFMAAKNFYGMLPWYLWPDYGIKMHNQEDIDSFYRNNQKEVEFWKFVQFLFFNQWHRLKQYAGNHGVKIIGDMGIYVSSDGADVWANRDAFLLDADGQPTYFAGGPPDYFSEEGQIWENPVYNWDYMAQTEYKWWIDRLNYMEQIYDVVRIDHFRGFESFYVIDREDRNAKTGKWIKAGGQEFFEVVKKELEDFPIIAEDLGFLTEEVHELRRRTGYPGMKVLQFAFDPLAKSDYLPHKYDFNCVVYTGTHDNDTICGWFDDIPEADKKYVVAYAALTKDEGYNWGMIRLMYASVADLAIAPLQDFLGLGREGRMNTPATVGKNWKWRIGKDDINAALAAKIKRLVELYDR